MQILRQSLVFVLVVVLAAPAWSDSNVVGSIVTGQSAMLRNAPLEDGSTVFSGDAVSAGTDGRAQIALTGGAQVAVLHDSLVRLTRSKSVVELAIERGTASFTSESNGALEAVLCDATIRPAQGPVFGIIHIENPDSAVVIAQKGMLKIATAHGPGTTTLREGQAARVTLVSELPAASNSQTGAKSTLPPGAGTASLSGTKLAVIAIIVGSAAAIAGIVLSVKEPKQSDQTLSNEVSPFTLQKK